MDGVECEFEFWPIEHPTEPLDEDRPLKCPMPHSPSLTNVSLFFPFELVQLEFVIFKLGAPSQ